MIMTVELWSIHRIYEKREEELRKKVHQFVGIMIHIKYGNFLLKAHTDTQNNLKENFK